MTREPLQLEEIQPKLYPTYTLEKSQQEVSNRLSPTGNVIDRTIREEYYNEYFNGGKADPADDTTRLSQGLLADHDWAEHMERVRNTISDAVSDSRNAYELHVMQGHPGTYGVYPLAQNYDRRDTWQLPMVFGGVNEPGRNPIDFGTELIRVLHANALDFCLYMEEHNGYEWANINFTYAFDPLRRMYQGRTPMTYCLYGAHVFDTDSINSDEEFVEKLQNHFDLFNLCDAVRFLSDG